MIISGEDPDILGLTGKWPPPEKQMRIICDQVTRWLKRKWPQVPIEEIRSHVNFAYMDRVYHAALPFAPISPRVHRVAHCSLCKEWKQQKTRREDIDHDKAVLAIEKSSMESDAILQPERCLLDNESKTILMEILRGLPSQDRINLVLLINAEFNIAKVAEVLKQDYNTTYRRLNRLLIALREHPAILQLIE